MQLLSDFKAITGLSYAGDPMLAGTGAWALSACLMLAAVVTAGGEQLGDSTAQGPNISSSHSFNKSEPHIGGTVRQAQKRNLTPSRNSGVAGEIRSSNPHTGSVSVRRIVGGLAQVSAPSVAAQVPQRPLLLDGSSWRIVPRFGGAWVISPSGNVLAGSGTPSGTFRLYGPYGESWRVTPRLGGGAWVRNPDGSIHPISPGFFPSLDGQRASSSLSLPHTWDPP